MAYKCLSLCRFRGFTAGFCKNFVQRFQKFKVRFQGKAKNFDLFRMRKKFRVQVERNFPTLSHERFSIVEPIVQFEKLLGNIIVFINGVAGGFFCLLHRYFVGLDFARNRFDSANYKMILKKNGVHLISVMEPIAEGSQGILVETLLEGMAEYYSAELSEKVIRGQTENALKGKCTGGTGTIGYKIDEEKFYHLDPLTAPLVLEAFQQYDNGDKMVEIVNFLNDKGVRNMQGGKMTHSSVNTMLKNRRYIGELSFRDIVVPDAIPAIVPKDLFDRVQKRLDKNKRAPACGKADEEYLLTTKLFCGKCGALMFGESGTSATGRTYYYYKCANVKRRKGCNKKTVQKEWLEDLVVRETMKLIQDDAVIDKIVQLVMDVQNQENTTIPLLEKQLREVNKKLDNLMKAIEDGLYTRTTKERLEALEIQKDELTAKIADEKLKKPSFNEDFIRFWLMKFRKFDISQKKQRKTLIEIFVNAIFLYDDRMLITFNYKDGTQTVRFEDALTADAAEEKSSDLSSSAGP